ncbi:regucalcin-like [Agrilus planipennis]|uniref:Regucalcin-like n=1 Tax=Agrilus planipennis TaxID=224129 RepID=A0A7F5R450_AGRPL|nr:regucalcin-like [Agrilus planipennis]
MAPKVERILENFLLGEGPHWDIATQSLYMVDIYEKRIHRYDPVTNSHYQAAIGDLLLIKTLLVIFIIIIIIRLSVLRLILFKIKGNRQSIFTFDKHNIPGMPDGQTIDSDGNLWVAVFLGSRVIKIDPRKPETLLETIAIPAIQTTSVEFGGPNLDELYVTSGRFTFQGKTPEPPVNGALYRVTNIGSKGLPSNKVKIQI